jgi:prepilin-type N-terminal cleavage/methylation domain-containing protein
MIRKNSKQTGFTIVELLVVIVVIGILAAITIVSYSGITQRANAATLQSDLKSASTKLAIYKAENDTYPPTQTDAENAGCLPASDGTVYDYSVTGDVYHLSATSVAAGSTAYHISSDIGSIEDGSWEMTWKKVSASGGFACSVASDSLVYCWGLNSVGQLGNNSTTNSFVPVAADTSGVLSGKTIKSVMAESWYACAIASDDLAYCWGQNTYGQLGNNLTTDSHVPVAVDTSGALSGKTVKAMTSGGSHTCAIASDDLAYCWGLNTSGQLGNNSTTNSPVPVAVDTSGVLSGKTIKAISAGGMNACVIASDDNAYCWGPGGSGKLGNNSTSNTLVPVAVDTTGVLSGKTVKALSTGTDFSCVIASDDNAYCWGWNIFGQLGNNSTTNALVPVAVDTTGVLSGKTVKGLSSGSLHACALASDDQAYCWGLNSNGRLGNNSTTSSSVPVAVSTAGVLSGKTVVSVSSGDAMNCAIASDNNAYCWGWNAYGQLGNNVTSDSWVPVAVQSLP